MNKNYRVQIGTVKVAAFWNEPKQNQKNRYYSICITRSSRDRDGNWNDEKIYIMPNEMMSLIGALNEIAHIVNAPSAFESNRNADSATNNDATRKQQINNVIDTLADSMDMNDTIPF